MDLKKLRDFLGKDWKETQACIRKALNSDISLLNSTNATILEASGKQLRPMLSLLIARACSSAPLSGDSWLYAAASELLHNATLLHDDVADDSEERRGQPTLYKQMGPAVSVLVGDYWLVKAVDCILGAEHGTSEVVRIFAKTLSDLAEGEMYQLQKAWSGDTDEDDYMRIIYNKTATLFETTARSAVIGVDGSKEEQDAMAEYAKLLGLAFQIRDDIFDYSSGLDIGKPVGADILEKKITMPLLGAFRNADAKTEAEIRKMVTSIDRHPECRDEIVSFVRENRGLDAAQEKLEELIRRAVGQLDVLPDSEEKKMLAAIAGYVGNRII